MPKNGNAKGCSNYYTIAFISHASKIMPQILQARLQQYVNLELPNVQAGFRKGRGTRDQIANIRWMIEKTTEFQENIYFCFTDYAKASDSVNNNQPWKILKERGISDHLTCLQRNQFAGQEVTVRTRHGTDCFKTGKGEHQGCILSPCLLQSTSFKMLGWMKHKVESRLQEEISITSDTQMTPSLTSDTQMTPSLGQKVKKN